MPTEEKDRDDISGKAEVIADAAEKIRQGASERVAIVRAKAEEYAVHLIPIDGENEDEAWDAAKWIAKSQEDELKIRAEETAADEKTYQYFLKCRVPTHRVGGQPAPPHGVYFVGKPDGSVGDQDWFATYKKRNAVWRGQEILCQVCLKMGIEHARLSYEWNGAENGRFTPDRRWVWKVPRNPKRAKIEGSTRAFDLPHEASNAWRAENAVKIAKAIQEGALTNG